MTRPFLALRRQTKDNYFDGRCERVACLDPQHRTLWGRGLCATHLTEVNDLLGGPSYPINQTPFFGCGGSGCLGAEPCEDCAAVCASGCRVIVVGERVNAGKGAEPRSQWGHSARLASPPNPYPVLHRYGGIKWGTSRDRLFAAGVRWDWTINLLPPHPKCGAWGAGDDAYAREVAEAILPHLTREYQLCVLMGARVAKAFGRDFQEARDAQWQPSYTADELTGDRASLLVIPHPSGQSRVWNDGVQLGLVRAAFRNRLDLTSPSGR